MAREYFCAYHSYLKSMRNLSDAECGRLFRALLRYSSGERSIKLQGRESIAFDFIIEQIDRDNAAYSAKCEQNRINRTGNGGQRPLTPVDGGQRPSTDVHKEKEKEKEKENYLSPPTPPAGGTGEAAPWAETPAPQGNANAGSAADAEFDRFWAAYPKQKSKGAARKAFAKARKKVTLDVMLAALEWQKTSWDWVKEGGQFIPYPSSWLNQEQWENNWDGGSPQKSQLDEWDAVLAKLNGGDGL